MSFHCSISAERGCRDSFGSCHVGESTQCLSFFEALHNLALCVFIDLLTFLEALMSCRGSEDPLKKLSS